MLFIREAVAQDFPAICRLIKEELGYPDLDETEALKRLEHFENSSDHATFAASADDEVIGFIGVMKGIAYNIEGYYSQIMALAVSEKARRCGVGTALVRRAEEWSLSHGITDIGVGSNMRRLEAHVFYENIGYAKRSFSFRKRL